MPPDGLEWKHRTELLSFEEIERVARLFVACGVKKIRLTGGEPTLRKDLPALVSRLARLPIEALLMTTNGYRIGRDADTYRRAGLTGLNISLDTLRPDRFQELTLRDAFDEVFAGIEAALQAGFDSVKVNVVVMQGVNEDEILDFAELTRYRPLTVRFIEFMPFEGNGWQRASLYPYARMRSDIASRYELVPVETEFGAVGKDFRIPGFAGSIGFVTSLTESFCDSCNRIRLTAEGRVKPCLFSPLERDLREPLRAGASDLELEAIVRAALDEKPKEHPPMDHLARLKNRSMVLIGG